MAEPSHILVVLPGRDPAGTLGRALRYLGDDRRMPHEVRVVAAPDRAAVVVREVLGVCGAARFAEACARAGFARDEILFNQRTVHAVDADRDGAVAAERLLALLRTPCHADDCALTVVVADDAGVAGYLLQACLHVVGRPSDRLLIDLGDVPFSGRSPVDVPLLLWPAAERIPATFADAVAQRRNERRRIVRPDVLRLDRRRRVLTVGETTIALPATQFFWLHYLASAPGERFPLAELSAGANGRPQPFTQRLSDGRVRTFPEDLQHAFVRMFPKAADKFDGMYRSACGAPPGLPSTISKINGALRRALGRGAAPYLIAGGRGAGGYRLTLPPSSIHVTGGDASAVPSGVRSVEVPRYSQ